jgi:hypothetical protein
VEAPWKIIHNASICQAKRLERDSEAIAGYRRNDQELIGLEHSLADRDFSQAG